MNEFIIASEKVINTMTVKAVESGTITKDGPNVWN